MKQLQANYCRLYIVRHGQTEGNLHHIFSNPSTDLTQEGVNQARRRAEDLNSIHFDAVYSSPMVRAKRTAKIIAEERKIAVITKEALREFGMGILEGKAEKELTYELKKLYAMYKALPEKDKWSFKEFEGMESGSEATGRFITVIREIAVAHRGQTVLVVAHGGTMRGLLFHLGWAAFEELPGKTIENTGYIVLDCDGVDFFVRETVGIKKQHHQ